jgi:hypothetical protein
MVKTAIAAALVVATLGCGTAQAGDKLGAVLGGVAVGAVGGAILGSALSAHAQQPVPVYVQAPPPRPVVVEYDDASPPPRVARDPFDDQAFQLHMRCDDGDRRACIRFGVLIGQHRERVAQWRRSHPDFFAYEN